MKNKIKKILTTALISMTATSAIGCATTNTKIAQKINNGVEDFVSSINNLDYVETNNSKSNLGKIVSAANENNLYSKVTSNTNIENTITRPTERSDNFKLYVLSESPFISLTSDDNNVSLSMQFSTEKIETTSNSINENINKLILKRAILMIYVNEIYSGNISLTDDNRKAINAYVNIIKENASFLNGNRGMVKNQLGMASDLISNKSEDNIVNYYIIKSGEALEIRSNKIDSTISAIDSIISILEQNLTPSSCYYQNNLTNSYQNMITNMNNNTLKNEDEILAKNIAESIDLISIDDNNTANNSNITSSTNTRQATTYPSTRTITNNTNKSIQTKTAPNCIDCDKNNQSIQNSTNLRTLEHIENNDKTTANSDNLTRNSQNNTNSNQNTNSQITPAETNRTRKIRNRLNRRNNLGNPTNQNNPTNPTLISEPITPLSNQNSQTNEQIKNRNSYNRTTSINQDNNNRVSRVPYRVTSNVN